MLTWPINEEIMLFLNKVIYPTLMVGLKTLQKCFVAIFHILRGYSCHDFDQWHQRLSGSGFWNHFCTAVSNTLSGFTTVDCSALEGTSETILSCSLFLVCLLHMSGEAFCCRDKIPETRTQSGKAFWFVGWEHHLIICWFQRFGKGRLSWL